MFYRPLSTLTLETEKSVEHVLSVVQTIVTQSVRHFGVEHDLSVGLVQTVNTQTERQRGVNHVLVPQQTISASQPTMDRTVEHLLTPVQTITYGVQRDKSVEHVLSVEQLIGYHSPQQSHIHHDLNVIQTITASLAKSRAIEHQLYVTQTITAEGITLKAVHHDVEVQQTITGMLAEPEAKSVEHVVTVQQTIDINRVVHKTVGHVLTVEQFISYVKYLIGDSPPTVGTDNRPDLTYPVAVGGGCESPPARQDQFTIEFPPTSPTDTVTLPIPVTGNQHELKPQRIQRKSRGGRMWTYADPSWPEVEILRWKFQALTETQRGDMLAVLSASLAKEVKVTDHEFNTYIGVINNPNGLFTELFRTCGHTAEFELQLSPAP